MCRGLLERRPLPVQRAQLRLAGGDALGQAGVALVQLGKTGLGALELALQGGPLDIGLLNALLVSTDLAAQLLQFASLVPGARTGGEAGKAPGEYNALHPRARALRGSPESAASSEWPVISIGGGRSISASRVGATSASVPPAARAMFRGPT